MSDDQTLEVYAQKAEDYATLVGDVAQKDPLLQAFIAALPEGGHVLDLGCGPGHYAAAMAHAGLRVTAVDPVPEMIALASAHPGVVTRQARFDDIEEEATYDGIWANFSLLHAPRAQLPTHLARLNRALKPNGRFHITMKTGEGETRDSLGRQYTYVDENWLQGALETAGFTVTGKTNGSDPGLSGEVSPWVALAAHA